MDVNELNSLSRKVDFYKSILQNTRAYRQAWQDGLRDRIVQNLTEMAEHTSLEAEISVRNEMENLEAVVLSLGEVKSGMFHMINDDIKRHLIKTKGSLIYQQLFNGKILVMMQMPYIERYGEPQPPKTIAIYRPEELKDPYLIRHMETFISDISQWEDYDDDDDPNKTIGFNFNFGELSEMDRDEE